MYTPQGQSTDIKGFVEIPAKEGYDENLHNVKDYLWTFKHLLLSFELQLLRFHPALRVALIMQESHHRKQLNILPILPILQDRVSHKRSQKADVSQPKVVNWWNVAKEKLTKNICWQIWFFSVEYHSLHIYVSTAGQKYCFQYRMSSPAGFVPNLFLQTLTQFIFPFWSIFIKQQNLFICLIRSCRRKYSRINVWVNIFSL